MTAGEELAAPGKHRFSRRVILFIAALIGAGVLLVVLFAIPPKSAFKPLPDPNGYYVLAQAASKVESGSADLPAGEIEALVAGNRPALDEIRRALELPCAVPVQMNQRWMRKHTAELSGFRRVAGACDMEALFLHRQGDATNALERCLDLARFSHAISRNGLLVTALMGMACESIAMRRITNLLSSLNAGECKRAIAVLGELERARETTDEIGRRELEWARRTYGFFVQLPMMIRGGLRPNKAVTARAEIRFQNQSREVRTAMMKLAARGFEVEHGRKPHHASELVPAFLPDLLLDPATQAPMELR